MTGWLTFATDPSFGVPVLILSGTFVAWWAANLHDPPVSGLRGRAVPPPRATRSPGP